MVGHTFLGRYEVVGSLGRGAMGQVYLARVIANPDEMVVVKVMHDQIADQPKFRQLFQRELEMMARFRHPYAVRLFDGSLDDPNGACIVMDYIPGETLETILRLEHWFDPIRTGMLLGPLCHALSAAHNLGVIHRDLKPANLMVTDYRESNEALKVMDLGLAMFAAKPYIPLEVLNGSGPGMIVGTPAYMPPEAIRGDEVDERGDVYSIGVTLFEMLTGSLPFPVLDAQAMMASHLTERPPLMSQIRPDLHIPMTVEDVVQSCLRKFPNERPHSTEELARVFGEAIELDIWRLTRPSPQSMQDSHADIDLKIDTNPEFVLPVESRHLSRQFEAWMPERIAVIKLRGFVEDHGGEILESEPGHIRVVLGRAIAKELNSTGGFLGWIGRLAMGETQASTAIPDPVVIVLRMEKPNPRENQLRVTASYSLENGHTPADTSAWTERCDHLHKNLRAYMIGDER